MSRAALGIDLGGSRSRALLLAEDGSVLAEAEAGPGNLTVFGEPAVAAVVDSLLAAVLKGGSPAEACCCGAAGAEDAAGRRQLERLLEAALPGIPLRIVPDPVLVLSAAGLDEGVALVAGTGSIAYGVAGGHTVRAGGWGPRLGDEGSGYWAVRDAVREILRAHDEGRPLDALQRELIERAGADDPVELMHLFHREPDSARWAALSALALADSDRLEQAAAELAGLAATARARLGAVVPVVLAGGVLLNTPGLEARIRARLPGDVTRLSAEPVLGAARMAWALLRTEG